MFGGGVELSEERMDEDEVGDEGRGKKKIGLLQRSMIILHKSFFLQLFNSISIPPLRLGHGEFSLPCPVVGSWLSRYLGSLVKLFTGTGRGNATPHYISIHMFCPVIHWDKNTNVRGGDSVYAIV